MMAAPSNHQRGFSNMNGAGRNKNSTYPSKNPYSDKDKLEDDEPIYRFGASRDYTGTTVSLDTDCNYDEESAITMDHFPEDMHSSPPRQQEPLKQKLQQRQQHKEIPVLYLPNDDQEQDDITMQLSVESSLELLHTKLSKFAKIRKTIRNVNEAREVIKQLEHYLELGIQLKMQQVEEEANVAADIEELQGIAQEISAENDELVTDIQDLLEENEILLDEKRQCQIDTNFLNERLIQLEKERDSLSEKLEQAEELLQSQYSSVPGVGGGTMKDAVKQLKSSMHRTLKEVAIEKNNLEEMIDELRSELDSTQDYMERLLVERQKMSRRLKNMSHMVDKCICASVGTGASVADSAATSDWTLSSQTQASSLEGTESSSRKENGNDSIKGWKESFYKHVSGGKSDGLEKGTFAMLPPPDKNAQGGVMRRLSRMTPGQHRPDPYGMQEVGTGPGNNPRRLSDGLAFMMSRQQESPRVTRSRPGSGTRHGLYDDRPPLPSPSRIVQKLQKLTMEENTIQRDLDAIQKKFGHLGGKTQTRGSTGSIAFDSTLHASAIGRSVTPQAKRTSLVQRCFTWNSSDPCSTTDRPPPAPPLLALSSQFDRNRMASIRSCGTEGSLSIGRAGSDPEIPKRRSRKNPDGSSAFLDDDESYYNTMFSVYGEDLSGHWTKQVAHPGKEVNSGISKVDVGNKLNTTDDELEEPEQFDPKNQDDELEEPEQLDPKKLDPFDGVPQNALGFIDPQRARERREQELVSRFKRRTSAENPVASSRARKESEESVPRLTKIPSLTRMKLPDNLPTPEEVFKAAREKGRKEMQQQQQKQKKKQQNGWLLSNRGQFPPPEVTVDSVAEDSASSLGGSVLYISEPDEPPSLRHKITNTHDNPSNFNLLALQPTPPQTGGQRGRRRLGQGIKDKLPPNVKHSRWGSKVFK